MKIICQVRNNGSSSKFHNLFAGVQPGCAGDILCFMWKVNNYFFFIWGIRGAIKDHFRKNLGFWPNKRGGGGGGGGGLTEVQVFVEIFQNQICLGKW